jgi:hypothetical protein
MYSTDGANWSVTKLPAGAAGTNFSDVTAGTIFVAVSYVGTNRIMTSANGITWTPSAAPQANLWYGVGYGAGTYVAVSFGGTNQVITSTNGTTWTLRTAGSVQSWFKVAYGNSIFVVTSYSATAYQTSPNGTTWTARTFPVSGLNKVKFGNGVFVVAGGTSVYSSTDGINWTSRTLPGTFSGNIVGLVFGNGKFAIAGLTQIVFSTDGATWTGPYAIPVRGDNMLGSNDRIIVCGYPAFSSSIPMYYTTG